MKVVNIELFAQGYLEMSEINLNIANESYNGMKEEFDESKFTKINEEELRGV